MNELIAVVDDEPDLVDLIRHHLQKAGFRSEGYPDGRKFLAALEKKAPDLILLDLMLPDLDGLEICRLLRAKEEWASIPVIMITAKGAESDRVLGLELGADDYVTKPFSTKELVARVKSVLRRTKGMAAAGRVEIGGILVVDFERYRVSAGGREVDLTTTEFKILRLLAEKKGRVFTRHQILDHLWGQEKIVLDRTIDVHIRNLREKLGPEAGAMIKNIRGVGYKLEE